MIDFLSRYAVFILLVAFVWVLYLYLSNALRRKMDEYRDIFLTLAVNKETSDVDIVNVSDDLNMSLEVGKDIINTIDLDKFQIKVVYIGVGYPKGNLIAEVPNEKSKKVYQLSLIHI